MGYAQAIRRGVAIRNHGFVRATKTSGQQDGGPVVSDEKIKADLLAIFERRKTQGFRALPEPQPLIVPRWCKEKYTHEELDSAARTQGFDGYVFMMEIPNDNN